MSHSEGSSEIPIWFFVGVLLTIYGAMIGGYGLYEVVTGHVAPVALAYLHAPLWWGAFLLAIGVLYCVKFAPKHTAKKK